MNLLKLKRQVLRHYKTNYKFRPKVLAFVIAFIFICILIVKSMTNEKLPSSKNNRPAYSKIQGVFPNLSAEPGNFTHIVMPFYVGQVEKVIANLKTWETFPPCTTELETPIKFVFYYSEEEATDNVLVDKIQAFINHPNFKKLTRKCISAFEFLPVQTLLDDKVDQHIEGARVMFEMMISKESKGMKKFEKVFYMEPDAQPIRANWAGAMKREAESAARFWVRGSIFRGNRELVLNTQEPGTLYHINGNAFYDLTDGSFSRFYFTLVRPWVLSSFGKSRFAYDTDICEYLHAYENYDYARHIFPYYQYTEFIYNVWHTDYSIEKLAKSNPDIYLAHGGYLKNAE